MKIISKNELKAPYVYNISNSEVLVNKIASLLNTKVYKLKVKKFKDDEICPFFEENIENEDIIIVHSTHPGSNSILELLLSIDAARQRAKSITIVIPYFGYSRQDNPSSFEPNSAQLMIRLIFESGATNIILCDIHNTSITHNTSYQEHIINISPHKKVTNYIKEQNINNIVVVSPDEGGSERIKEYARILKCKYVVCKKKRSTDNLVQNIEIDGNLNGKNVIIIDDIIDTGNTLLKTIKKIKKTRVKSIRVYCTHHVLSKSNITFNGLIDEFITTNSLEIKNPFIEKIKIIDLSEIIIEKVSKILDYYP